MAYTQEGLADILDALGRAIHPYSGDPELCRALNLPHRSTTLEVADWRAAGCATACCFATEAGCEDEYRRPPPPRQKSQLRVRWKPHRFAPLDLDDTTQLLAAAEAMSRRFKAVYWANPQWCLRESARELWGPENWRTLHVWSVVPSPSRRTVRSLEKRRAAAVEADAATDGSVPQSRWPTGGSL